MQIKIYSFHLFSDLKKLFSFLSSLIKSEHLLNLVLIFFYWLYSLNSKENIFKVENAGELFVLSMNLFDNLFHLVNYPHFKQSIIPQCWDRIRSNLFNQIIYN